MSMPTPHPESRGVTLPEVVSAAGAPFPAQGGQATRRGDVGATWPTPGTASGRGDYGAPTEEYHEE